MTLDENIVYFYCKKLLKKSGIYVFAGEPPGGSDELHRVELKHPNQKFKGSKGSRKFDLIAYHMSSFLLIELKDSSEKHQGDIIKLNDTIKDKLWIKELWNNMNDRRLFGKDPIPNFSLEDFTGNRESLFQPCLGAGPSNFIPPDNFIYFEVDKNYLKCRGRKVKNKDLISDIIKRTSLFN
jgi:hypothetical protein